MREHGVMLNVLRQATLIKSVTLEYQVLPITNKLGPLFKEDVISSLGRVKRISFDETNLPLLEKNERQRHFSIKMRNNARSFGNFSIDVGYDVISTAQAIINAKIVGLVTSWMEIHCYIAS